MIDNLVIDNENLKFVSSSTLYEDNNGAIILAISTRINPKPKHNDIKYKCLGYHVGNEYLIWKIEPENQKVDIFTKGL